MRLSELILKYGDGNVELQNLDKCIISIDWSIKKKTHITFGTEMAIDPSKGTEKLGLVLWFDRDKMNEILKETT